MAKVISVFVSNLHLSPAGVQFLAGLTTFLMVLRFVLDYNRHRSISQFMRNFLLMLDGITYSLLHYSLGVMQRPSLKNSYYQVWAVLLVTLRYSVKHGRPAGVALKQTPLVDLMSSFWAANILRSHAPRLLKVPVWLLWSVNSARIIHGFVSSEHATAEHRENVRLVTEYMRRPKTTPASEFDPVTMAGYEYLVLGEAKQRKKVQPPDYRLELDQTKLEKLITVDKIWKWSRDNDDDQQAKRVSELLNQRDGKLKDLCLSFALYKLLRRKFFTLPIHEEDLPETKRLVFEGILDSPASNSKPEPWLGRLKKLYRTMFCVQGQGDNQVQVQGALAVAAATPNYKRALRIAKVELAFVNDFFFSRHALMFATGFPFLRLLLSTLLLGAISYMAVAIHRFSRTATEDELGRVRVHHGVFFTWILLTLLGVKEMVEIASYVFSDWTKVMLLCKYVRQPWWLRGPAMAMLVRLLCRYSLVRRWDGKIGQYNLVFAKGRRNLFRLADFTEDMQEAIFTSFGKLRNDVQSGKQPLDADTPSYVDRALLHIPTEGGKGALKKAISKVLKDLKGDVRTILLWHIATCYCDCYLAHRRREIGVKPWYLWSLRIRFCPFRIRFLEFGIWAGPSIQWSKRESLGKAKKHYMTAVTLSQYCAHLVRMRYPLIPGNDIVIDAVFKQVLGETCQALHGCVYISEIFPRLAEMGRSCPGNDERTLLQMGSQIGQMLIEIAGDNNTADEFVWKFLEELWAGFVLHLAESTVASKHKIYLSRGGDLMTHLWALLCHAGRKGRTEHGEMGHGEASYYEVDRAGYDMNT